ncbi:MAG TPA: amidohydrolase family protein [Dehalococcoidia bacterium]|nr:amidohydrolase family protein [Dehalococcoidia bacterium]
MRIQSAFLVMTIIWLSCGAEASDQVNDRSAYYQPGTETTNDLRRVPMPPGFGDPAGAILVRNARLFDGTGVPARPATILIEGSRISKIVSSEQGLALPEDVQIIDADGKTVMPGLIDLHTHMTYLERPGLAGPVSEDSQSDAALRGVERMRYFVESGITSVRDVGSHGMAPFQLKLWQYLGRIPGPRMFVAGQLIVGAGGHGTESFTFHTAPEYPDSHVYEATGADEFRAAVRLQFKRGADLIKLASHFNAEEVKAVVDEAHMLGLRVTVDSETIFTDMAVAAGVDCVEHPLPRSDATIRLMAKQGTCAIVTLVPYQYILDTGGYFFSTSRRFTLSNETMFAMARKMKDAGVKLGVGTDVFYALYKSLPEPYIQELRNFVQLGFSPSEALVAATRTNSEILGMSDRLGTAEEGKLADLIIVDGRPDENLDDLRKIDIVLLNGTVVVQDGRIFIPRHTEEKVHIQ